MMSMLGIMFVSQWFDDAVSVWPDWITERGSSVETADSRMSCYVQDSCPLAVLPQVCS